MRFLGNKTKLLDEMHAFMTAKAVSGETFLDVFTGTASVARYFRSQGWLVHSNDLLAASYIRQRTYVSLAGEPRLPDGGLERSIDILNHVAHRRGLISRQFSEGSPMERLYFSQENAAKIDGVWAQIVNWYRDDQVDEDGFYVLLTALLEAADRVANISGTYGAYLKAMNSNAKKAMKLRVPKLDCVSPAGTVHRRDANELVRDVEVDVLYLDPPYNQRQYVKYYHVPEILAELHEQPDLWAYEQTLYGQTGLRDFDDRLSDYCKKRRVVESFRDLVLNARAAWIILSYSEEGIMTYEEIVKTLEQRGQVSFRVVNYRRFRSDNEENREVGSTEVMEWMFICQVRSQPNASPGA